MSILDDCQSTELTKVRGQATLPDEYDLSLWASLALNCEFLLNEQVQTRRGFALVINVVGNGITPLPSITGLFNWVQKSYLLVYDRINLLWRFSLIDYTYFQIDFFNGVTTAETVDFASFGARVMYCPTNADGSPTLDVVASSTARVTDGTWVDHLFQAPLATLSFSITEPAAGTVSGGIHYFAVVFTTRSGYETRPSPLKAGFASSGSLNDLSPGSTFASGSKNLRVQINGGTWPVSYVSAALLMTVVENPNRYFFVPGCTVTIPGGSGGSVTFPDIDIPDEILAADSSREAVNSLRDYFALYSQSASGGGPFAPRKVISYSNRAVYIVTLADGTDAMFISEKNATQWVTLANHLVQLPGKRQITTGFVLAGTLFLVGPGWTFGMSDNNSLPVTWTPAQEVDGRLGTSSITGVDVNSSLGYAWVAHDTGLYLFNIGGYTNRPATYLNTADWNRINWTAPQGTIQVKDFPSRKMVLVKVPLDGATKATHLFAVDYANGPNWDQCNFSIWDIASFHPGVLENVFEPRKKIYELWVGNYDNGNILRSKSVQAADANLYNDNSLGIDWQWTSPAISGKSYREPKQWVGVSPRIRGSGTITLDAVTFDATRTHALAPITAASAPGKWPLRLLDVQSEGLHIKFTNGAVANVWAVIAGLKSWWTDWIADRG